MIGKTWARRLAVGVLALAPTGAVTASPFADAPPDAKTIADFIAAYAGQAALPSVEVKPDGAGYLVTVDIGAATSQFKAAGVSYEPAKLRFRVVKQDDGQWRVELADLPALTGHMTGQKGEKIDFRVETEGVTQVYLIDPKLNWIASGHSQASKIAVNAHGPATGDLIEVKDLAADLKTTSGPQGLATIVTEPIGHFNFVLDLDPKGLDPKTGGPAKPQHISASAETTQAGVSLAGFQPTPLLDAWRFAAAHPVRADCARDFPALKSVLTALVADPLNVEETFKIAKLDILTEAGQATVENAGFGVTAFNGPAGAGFGESVSAGALKLPDGLVPPVYASLVPTSFDLAVKASGFDVASAAQEWMADAKLDGTGPILNPADEKKVNMKLWAFRPVLVEIAPSHFVSASYDVTLEGKVTIDKGSPTATVTIKAKNFDQTAQAIQSAAPEQAQQMTPVIAMAKGLGKAQPDGSLLWVYTLGADKVMKVNGLPLGKSPY